MSSELHFQGQTTKKYSLPLSHLEYSYIEKCTNEKELEKIVYILRSGDEGKFPDLERFAERRLETLNPKSPALRKECPILRQGDLDSGDWNNLQDELKSWTSSMHEKEAKKSMKAPKGQGDIVEVDENLPPVRSSNIVLEGKKQKKSEEKKKKKAVPRDYKEWDKLDVDAELKAADSADNKTTKKEKLNGVSLDLDTSGMSEEERNIRANREKDKGNEAFKSQDYEEAVTYYSRSISLVPIAASYNNRALAYLKLKKWDRAIRDCNSVLNIEKDNIKALLRRGTAYKSKKDNKKALLDLVKVLQLEPNNKKAEGLLKEVKQEITDEEKERKEKGGRRMVIDEVDSEDDEPVMEIEAEKPLVNGQGIHYDCNAGHISPVSPETEAAEMDKSSNPVPNLSSSHLQSQLSNLENIPEPKPQSEIPALASIETTPDPKTHLCKESSAAVECSECLTPDALSLLEKTCDLPSAESPIITMQQEEDSQTPDVTFILSQSSSDTKQAASQVTSESADTAIQNSMSRPQFVQLPLPPAVSELKENGNRLFRSGQYGEAVEQYSQAIAILEKEIDQQVNLSILLSNRAACHLKIGDLSQTISDCCLSLKLVPHSAKVLLRRAAAYESLEKYAEAYVDYKHVISLDISADQAHQGATRCQNTLQINYGPVAWREKVPPLILVKPWEVPLIDNQSGLSRSMSSTVSLPDLSQSLPPVSISLTSEEKAASFETPQITSLAAPLQQASCKLEEKCAQLPAELSESIKIPDQKCSGHIHSKEEEFEHMKATGNQHVQKGQFQEAAKCYSACISLCPDQVACYTNRALCYLKLNKAIEAETDCDKALSLQADNPKALYRRALARKMSLKYKPSLQDLIELLKLEPKNSAAQKEMDIVKKCYKEELEMLKKKTIVEQESKVRKRVKIEEVDDDDEEEKPKSKVTEKTKAQSKLRSGKQPQQSVNKSKNSNTGQKLGQTRVKPDTDQPVAPPIAPRLMKTTPYEFCQAWNSLKSCQVTQPYADLLRQISPSDLPSVISNKLDGQMLQVIVRCVNEEMVLKGDVDLGYQILDKLCQVPRFSTVSMFMSSKEKKEVSSVLDILSQSSSSAYTSADIVRLKKEYSVK